MAYRDVVLADSPVWYARLGEPSGTTAADEVAAFDGTYANTPTLAVAGAIRRDANTAATFAAASSEYVSIPDDARFDFGTGDWSLEVWAKLASAGATLKWLMSKKDQFNLYIDGTGHLGLDNFAGTWTYSSTATVNGDTGWHHYVATRSGSTFALYRDGFAVAASASGSVNLAANAAEVRIGIESDDGFGPWDGSLDEPAIYDHALTATQVRDHFLAGSPAVIARGTGARNTGSESSYAIVPASAFSGVSGAMAVLAVSYDNSGSSGADPYSSISDTNGNAWTSRQNALIDPGAASAGQALRIFTTPMAGGALDTGDTITVSFGNTTVARSYALWEVIPQAGYAIAYGTGAVETATTASPTITTSSIAEGDIVIGAIGREGNDAHTADSDTTNGVWGTAQASGVGTTTSGSQVASQWKVATAAGTQTYNPTFGSSRDACEAWVSIVQTAAAVTVTPSTASLSLATFAPVLRLAVTPPTLALSLATSAPTVQVSDHKTVSPPTASVSLAAFAPAVTTTAHQTVTPTTAALATAPFAPTVTASDHKLVTPTTTALTTAAFAPAVTATAHQAVTPTTASLALASSAPTVTVGDAQALTPDAASLALTALAPTVSATAHVTVTPSAVALSLAAFAPTGAISDHKAVTPAPASLAMTAFAPGVVASDHKLVTPTTASLALAGYAPLLAPPFDHAHAVGTVTLDAAPAGVVTVGARQAGTVTLGAAPTGTVTVSAPSGGTVTLSSPPSGTVTT